MEKSTTAGVKGKENKAQRTIAENGDKKRPPGDGNHVKSVKTDVKKGKKVGFYKVF